MRLRLKRIHLLTLCSLGIVVGAFIWIGFALPRSPRQSTTPLITDAPQLLRPVPSSTPAEEATSGNKAPPSHLSPNPTELPLPSSAPHRASDTSLENLFSRLKELNDPEEKRLLRMEIAARQPASETFKFTLTQYLASQNKEEKLQLESILAQINAFDIVPEVQKVASETIDEDLFVSLAYSLGEANTTEANEALFLLMQDNRLPRTRNEVFYNQGISALYRNLMDSLQPEDVTWLRELMARASSSEPKRLLFENFIQKYNLSP